MKLMLSFGLLYHVNLIATHQTVSETSNVSIKHMSTASHSSSSQMNEDSETPDDAHVYDISVNGNGCSEETTAISLTEDGKTMSFLFDQYNMSLGQDKRWDLKYCNIKFKLHIPKNMKAAVVQTDFRGYALVPEGGKAVFSHKYFMGFRKIL